MDNPISDIEKRILQVLESTLSVNLTLEEFRSTKRLNSLMGMDSMAILEFVAGLENEFQFIFPPERLESDLLTDIPELVSYISDHLAKNSN